VLDRLFPNLILAKYHFGTSKTFFSQTLILPSQIQLTMAAGGFGGLLKLGLAA
jgi:hypothetical protein